MKKSTKSLALAVAAIIVVAGGTVVALSALGLLPFSILPGFEGITAGWQGIEINGQYYNNSNSVTLPTGWSWQSNEPTYTTISYAPGAFLKPSYGLGTVNFETRTPYTITDQYSTSKTVDYWVRVNASYFVHVHGVINIYDLPITVQSVQTFSFGNGYPHIFSGETLWLALGSTHWDQALQEQSPYNGAPSIYGQAWEAPIAAYIMSYNSYNDGLYSYVSPNTVGRQLTLYSTPSEAGTISDLWTSPDINSTMYGFNPLAPDSRMQQYCYTPFTLQNFGETVYSAGLGGSDCPVVNYDIKVYTLQIGVYTYTNPDATPWFNQSSQSTKPVWAWLTDPILAWFANPWNVVGLFVMVGLVATIIVVIYLLYIGIRFPLARRVMKGAAK